MDMLNSTEEGLMIPIKAKGKIPFHIPVKPGQIKNIPEEGIKTAKKMGLVVSANKEGNSKSPKVENKRNEGTTEDKKKTLQNMNIQELEDIYKSLTSDEIPKKKKDIIEAILKIQSKK